VERSQFELSGDFGIVLSVHSPAESFQRYAAYLMCDSLAKATDWMSAPNRAMCVSPDKERVTMKKRSKTTKPAQTLENQWISSEN
jgi:hypothetical protein